MSKIKGQRLSLRNTPQWMFRAREKALSPWFQDNEIMELRQLPMYLLKRFKIIQGRRNQVKDVEADAENNGRHILRKDAIRGVYMAYRAAGGKVDIGEYINYYAY